MLRSMSRRLAPKADVPLPWLGRAVLLAAASIALASTGWAQNPPPAADSVLTGAVTGTVNDPTGRPLADVDIILTGTTKRTRSDAAGRFSIRGITPGAVELLFRKLGFEPFEGPLFVNAGREFSLGVVLNPRGTLSRVVVTAEIFNELRGFVVDDNGNPLAGATVQLGSERQMQTGADGRFLFANVPPGRWLLRATKDSLKPKQVGFQMLAQLERDITLKLERPDAGDLGPGPDDQVAWQEHSQRRAFIGGSEAELFTREDLAQLGDSPLDVALPRLAPRAFAAIQGGMGTARGPTSFGNSRGQQNQSMVEGAACLLFNGITPVWNQPLRTVLTSQLEAIEIYPPNTETTRTTCVRFPTVSPCNCATGLATPVIFVLWTR
jgi:hypothetical protein